MTTAQRIEADGDHAGQSPTRTDRTQLTVICAASFVVWLGFGAILPYLPIFLREQADASMFMVGLVTAGFAVGTFLFSSPLGRLSDSVGRKPVLLAGVLLYVVATFLFMLTTHPEWFILFRFLEGVGAAAVTPVSQALVADITPRAERSRAYGWLTSAQFGGLVFGPALAVPLYAAGGGDGLWAFYAIFVFGCAASLLTALALFVLLREPPHMSDRRREKTKRPPLRVLLTAPVVAFIVLAFLTQIAFGTYEVLWSIYLRDLGAPMSYVGYTWTAFSIPMLFAFLGGRLADRYDRFLLLLGGYGVSAAAWILYGTTADFTLFIIVNVIEGIAIACSFPAKQAFLVQVSPPRWLGTITGMENTAMYLAMLVGSLTAPLLYEAIGGLAISVSGGLALLGLLATAPILRRTWQTLAATGNAHTAGVRDLPGRQRSGATSRSAHDVHTL